MRGLERERSAAAESRPRNKPEAQVIEARFLLRDIALLSAHPTRLDAVCPFEGAWDARGSPSSAAGQ